MWYAWKPYVPAAARRAAARREMEGLRKKGQNIQPVEIEGRKIARTFWGCAWCEHLEKFSDYENRLPRGRTYVRNGSVCHLEIQEGKVLAQVAGSSLYKVTVAVEQLSANHWNAVKSRCAGQIGSLLELLQGKLSDHVMEIVTDRDNGLFPLPKEIKLKCSCPDWATMCKHVAAVLYGVGARLDREPELLFRLRGVNHEELIADEVFTGKTAKTGSARLDDRDLGDVFGIDMAEASQSASRPGTEKPVGEQEQPKRGAKANDRALVAPTAPRKRSPRPRAAKQAIAAAGARRKRATA